MRDVVIVPTIGRAEYLSLCLEHIRKADPGKEIWVSQDRRLNWSDPGETAQVAKQFGARLIKREPHQFIGNAFNFLESYREAFEQSDVRFVYLVEDDVMVGGDFFRWHEAVQKRGDYLCSVGWHCIRNPEAKVSDDALVYIESARDFSSIGVCWKREHLSLIVEHAKTAYYADLNGYMRQNFPQSPIPPDRWTEQAGLVMRVLLSTPGTKVAWACRPRCAHVGISGYHRQMGHRFRGTLEERVEKLRDALSERSKIAALTRDEFDDINLLLPEVAWKPEDLYVLQRFEDKRA